MQRLLEIMARLRDPQHGCPWDREQSFSTIAPYTIEEAYEVADAIEQGAMDELRDELGDLLFQVAFYTQMAREQELFDFDQVVAGICDKMVRRHPHVFGDATVEGVEAQSHAWERLKAEERQRKGRQQSGQLAGVARALPALLRAEKLQKRAAKVGFDWPDCTGVLGKVREELEELEQAQRDSESHQRQFEELGDLLFSCVNLARHLGLDAEQALRQANGKFERRFGAMEAALAAQQRPLAEVDIEELERLWEQVKSEEQS